MDTPVCRSPDLPFRWNIQKPHPFYQTLEIVIQLLRLRKEIRLAILGLVLFFIADPTRAFRNSHGFIES
jgi:hypothetical protein